MSAFSALADCEGDATEITATKREQKAALEEKQRMEAEKTKKRFEDLKAKAGMANWADSDDDDMFKSPALPPSTPASQPPGLGLEDPPKTDWQEGADEDESEEEAEEEEAEDDAAAAAAEAAPAGAPAAELEPKVNARKAKKEQKQAEELAELDSLMAELDGAAAVAPAATAPATNAEGTADKENPGGMSKAAQKRAKKKAKEAAGAPAAPETAGEGEGDAGEGGGEGDANGEAGTKSAEEIRQMMKAKADASKKKKKGGANGGAAAAAQAELKARGPGQKKKVDKSTFNQEPR